MTGIVRTCHYGFLTPSSRLSYPVITTLLPRHCEQSEAISCILHLTLDVLQHIKESVVNKQPAIYLLTNKPRGTLYTGVTSNLPKRIWEHRNKVVKGFSTRYNLAKLVYFELCEDMYQALTREKQIKAGSRESKIKMIEKDNPSWRDLYRDICN